MKELSSFIDESGDSNSPQTRYFLITVVVHNQSETDYLCTIELAAVKYAARKNGGTYDKFFGGIGAFKRNWLKQARRKAIENIAVYQAIC